MGGKRIWEVSHTSFLLSPLRLICLSWSWNLQLIETWVACKVNLQARYAQEISSLTEELILVSLTGTRSGFGRRCVQPGVLSDSLARKAFREEHLIKGGLRS